MSANTSTSTLPAARRGPAGSSDDDTGHSPLYVVGVGASAGGLEALRTLFGGLEPMRRLSYVVVQHLAPQHRSRLVELIAHETPLQVQELTDGTRPEAGVVYVTPPNADVVYENGALHLRNPAPKIGPKPSVDLFLTTLAEALGERAIGLILSGTGSDGSHGMRAIKAAGGLTLCQDPASAKYDGMPRAALQTGAVDLTLTPEQLAKELLRLDRQEGPVVVSIKDDPLVSGHASDPFARILQLIEQHTGVDLTDYKNSTIRRRIERRMAANEVSRLADYADLLESSDAEARLLFGDILISVTSFFRDADAFEILQRCILERVRSKHSGEQFRCWVAGCATGEEAYSIAMLIREAMEESEKRLRVQIFATDLDEQALLTARKACYSKASLVDLPERLTERYFLPVDDRLQVIPEIREMVVFARHNLVSDPPFLGMDLISCRNVLIYFTSSLQERVLRTFHYSLEPKGLLFLGRSETASNPPGCFEPMDKFSKVFVRDSRPRELPQPRARREVQREAALTARDRQQSAGMEVFYSLVSAIAPDSVLIDEDRKVLQLLGSAGDYLRLPSGEMTMTLGKLIPAALAGELNTLLHRASKSGRAVRGQRYEIELPGRGKTRIQMQAVPINLHGRQEFLIGFDRFAPEDRPAPPIEERIAADASAEDRIEWLEHELKQAREQLQDAVEQHETANEELQALNEELQSTNEELQSSNEELETTNEELQSSNEELTTLNQELNVKSAELQMLNQRLGAIQSAIFYPLLIVDKELRLQNFNPASRYLFRLAEADLGGNINSIPSYIDISGIHSALKAAFAEDKDQSIELSAHDRSFEVRIQLFRDGRQQTVGAVVSFVELTELRHALEDARLRQQQISALTENTPALITMKDSQGVYTYVNSRFCEVIDRRPEAIIGRTDEELFGQAVGGELRERDFEVLKLRRAIQGEEDLQLQDSTRCWLSSRFPLLDSQNRAYSVCTVSLDITERKRHVRELALFRQVVSDATDGLLILHDERGDADFRTVYCSGSSVSGRGLNTDSLMGTPLQEALRALIGEPSEVDLASLAAELLGSDTSCVLRLNQPGEAERWIDLRSRCLSLDESAGRHLVLMINDVTRRVLSDKTLQDQKEALARFSRLAALGEVAAGISHEISTPLNAITTKTELVRRMVDQDRIEPKRMHKATRDIDRMVAHIDEVITGLKSISRMNGHSERERVDIVKLLDDTLRIVAFNTRRRGIPVQLEQPDSELHIWCNPVQISQILVNLINNALDAVDDSETPWVRIATHDHGDSVAIDVVDSGNGVPSEIAERIMTPFFTTKDAGKGTGLGLSLSRNIARRHGGDLELHRNAKPTTFRLLLPKEPVTEPEQESV